MTVFSSGPVAKMLGVERDDIQSAFRSGAPEPNLRVAGKRVFTINDVQRLRLWFISNGRKVNEVNLNVEPVGA